jgi:two-component system sensor histidine kinase HydH
MAALKGHAQLLLEQLQEGTRPHDKASRVVSEAERLEALSEDLLSFVRTTTIDPHNVSPGELFRDCVAEVGDSRIELSIEKAPQRWRLDPARMQQVLGNLLRNAIEASPPDGRVVATASVEDGELLFTIRDFGKGIREPDLERIFEPFYTTRARGTGLGLAIARRLVALHGGTITAQNADEGGALFRVRLPNAARSGTQLKGV